ncbi:MAG TPA: hypothetical protein VGL50_00780 [Steroidobacteraceae bacterium]|jgi:hypothetical protein
MDLILRTRGSGYRASRHGARSRAIGSTRIPVKDGQIVADERDPRKQDQPKQG